MSLKTDVLPGQKRDGFFYGYVILIATFCLQVLGMGVFNSLGVFIKPLMGEFGWSRAEISGAFSVAYLVCAGVGILQGGLNDRFGPRQIMTGCGIMLGVGYFFMSRVSVLWTFYLSYCLFVGIGLSGTDVVLLSTLARWFVKKRGMMTGIAKVGTGVGMLIMPIFMNHSIALYGWRTTLVIIAMISMVLYTGLSQFLVRDPGKKGLFPDGMKNDYSKGGISKDSGLELGPAVRTPQFWVMCSDYFIAFFCASTILIHIVPHVMDQGISAANAAKVLSTIGALSIAGRFIMGGAGDRIGNKNALVICFVCLLIGLLYLQISDRLWMLIVFAVIYGFAHGGFWAIISPILAELFGTVSHGIIYGIVTFASSIGGALGAVTAGYVFDITQSYGIVFLVLTGMCLTGLFATIPLKPVNQQMPDTGC